MAFLRGRGDLSIIEFLVFAGLIAAVVRLFKRTAALETALEELRGQIDWRSTPVERQAPVEPIAEPSVEPTEEAIPVPDAGPVPSPAEIVDRRPATVPTIALKRGDVLLVGRQNDVPSTVTTQTDPRDDAPHYNACQGYSSSRFSSLDFEEIFGRRLPIWAGGIALAVAGVFLVRYSIEAGLLTPMVRVVLAFLFGLALLAGAEAAYRFEDRVADPRVRQALAGAGLATLYAGFYLAGSRYGLIGQGFAFLGLAAVTAAAIALSYRFGLPSAVLGLVGGFAAPALVGGDEANLPLLSLYLGLVTAGLTMTGKRQQRPWLGVAALAAGLGWGALLLLNSDMGVAGLLALGLYIAALGTMVPALVGAETREQPLRLAAALVSSAQLALLVHQGGYTPIAWGLYLLLAAALAWFGWRRADLREGNCVAAVIGVLLYAQWGAAPPMLFTGVGAALAVVFGGVPLALTWLGRQRRIDLAQMALVAPALAAVAYGTFGDLIADKVEGALAAATIALALLPLAGAWRISAGDDRGWFAGLIGSGAALVFAALLMVTPGWSAPLVAATVLAGPIWLTHRQGGAALANLLWVGALVTVIALAVTPYVDDELRRLGGYHSASPVLHAILRWLALAVPFLALAWLERRPLRRQLAELLGAATLYGIFAQFVPADWLAWTAALLALGAAHLQPHRLVAHITLAAIALLWALEPAAQWAAANIATLAADPAKVGDLPTLTAVALQILPLLACAVALPIPAFGGRSIPRSWIAAPLVLIAVHTAFKQIFAIETDTAFVAQGMAERTIWQGLLVAAAWFADRGVPRIGRSRALAIALAAAALGHFLVYTAVLHNALWSRQTVGPVPFANLVLAASAIAIIALWLLRGWLDTRLRPVIDGLVMAVVTLCAITLLRQGFGGTIPAETPVGQTEDLLRSLLGILLALAFLWFGSRRNERSWRIGSLVLMLLAVAKVFLLDAAGLEGLLRIASFMALGFSLIGIGWIYSRQLRNAPMTAQ